MVSQNKPSPEQTLVLVAGCRTPFAKAGGELAGATAGDLATHVFREVLDRTGWRAGDVDEVILGCAGPDSREANPARVAALRAGVPEAVPALTVQRNCASGLEALLAAQSRLRAGEGDVFLVGGAESMSNYPLLMGPKLTGFFQRLQKSRTVPARLGTLLSFRPSFLKPRIAILEGLTDPVTGLTMGHTAENVGRRFGIDREAADSFALVSHQRATAAREAGHLAAEITPLTAAPKHAQMLEADNGIRDGQTREALAKLRPVFDRREGDVTAGNASQVTDGAVGLLVMSAARAKAEGLEPLAVIRSHTVVGLDPAMMGLGPAHAIPKALAMAGVPFDEIERFEINEAFASQVLGCLDAMASDTFGRDQLGLSGAVGAIDPERLNVLGGAIALGHPIAATGARLALTLATQMQRDGLRYGCASLCVGGGQGQALVLERPAA